MKYKFIFWFFNGIVLMIGLTFSIIPSALFDKATTGLYWASVWPIGLLFFALIILIDLFFLIHWSMFQFLEERNWRALVDWLETQMYQKKRIFRLYVNLFVSTALSISDTDAVKKLEQEIRKQKPKMLKAVGVSLGIPVILEQNPEAIIRHYGPLADNPNTQGRDWAKWCRASFSGEAGINELFELLKSKNLSICILALWNLNRYAESLNPSQLAQMKQFKEELQSKMNRLTEKKQQARLQGRDAISLILEHSVNQARQEMAL